MAKPLSKLLSMLTPKRRWAQFSLLTMLVAVTVLCMGLSLVVTPAERQRRAVAAINAIGGYVEYVESDQEEPDHESFLRRWLPQDYFDEVQAVDLTDRQITDTGLAHLQGLVELEWLSLGGTQVTDAGLAHVQGLTRLETLWLNDTQVTDAGLAHLRRLTGLQTLLLSSTQVSDAGLAHLQELTGLEWLDVEGTQVTYGGLVQFKQALPNCKAANRSPMSFP